MGHFQDYESNINELINENDYYIVFYNGKAIRRNIDDEYIDIRSDESFDPFEICERKRTTEEGEIVKKSPFTISIHINKNAKLKVIIVNDKEDCFNIVYAINENVKAEINKIYLNVLSNFNSLVDIDIEQNASLDYCSIELCNNDFKEIMNAYLDENASFNLNSLEANKHIVNNECNVYLYGVNAQTNVHNSIINKTGLVQNYNYNIYHLNTSTVSELLNYAICKNTSILNINSNGEIKKGCSKSVINQKSRGIILDLNSSISANPILKIDEFDVVANHGASIGAIDDEDLYYLMSRGLTKEESESLIVIAYVNPMIKAIKDEKIKNYLEQLISKIIY